MSSLPPNTPISKLLECDRDTNELIRGVIKRQREAFDTVKFDALQLSMDLTVCHNLGQIDLVTLLAFPLGSFAHDLSGITLHLDRETGQLTNGFVPRCRREAVSE